MAKYDDSKYLLCTRCRCQYPGWLRECPVCGTGLVDDPPGETVVPLAYEQLVAHLREHDGVLEIDVQASAVGLERRPGLPFRGFGPAWLRRMVGSQGILAVDLWAQRVAVRERRGYPYAGYAFGWTRAMAGGINGNSFQLEAPANPERRSWRLPYFGFGYGWVPSLAGRCGSELLVELQLQDVWRRRLLRVPFRNRPYAWPQRGRLTLRLVGREAPCG